MQTVEVIADHEVKREAGAGELFFLPVAIGLLFGAKPLYGAPGRVGPGLTRRDVA